MFRHRVMKRENFSKRKIYVKDLRIQMQHSFSQCLSPRRTPVILIRV